MRRALALALLVALSALQALPLVAAARSEGTRHHPAGCPWKGTAHCPHAHHGSSSQPAWSPCAEVPIAPAGEARLGWAPPAAAAAAAPAPRAAAQPVLAADPAHSGPLLDIEIPPPRTVSAL